MNVYLIYFVYSPHKVISHLQSWIRGSMTSSEMHQKHVAVLTTCRILCSHIRFVSIPCTWNGRVSSSNGPQRGLTNKREHIIIAYSKRAMRSGEKYSSWPDLIKERTEKESTPEARSYDRRIVYKVFRGEKTITLYSY